MAVGFGLQQQIDPLLICRQRRSHIFVSDRITVRKQLEKWLSCSVVYLGNLNLFGLVIQVQKSESEPGTNEQNDVRPSLWPKPQQHTANENDTRRYGGEV